MSEVKHEEVMQNKPGTVEVETFPVKKVSFATLSDAELMNMMLDKNLEIPLDNGKLVRNVAIAKIKSYEEAAKPINSYRKMRVIFHRSGKEAEAPYVFMSLNGYAVQAPYEKEVLVPEPMIRSCIDNAVATEYDLGEFDKASGCTVYRERQIRMYPYTFLGYEE